MKTYNAESGRSMIEMLGVLAIIGVLSVGGIAGYSKAMMKYRINKTIEQISLVSGNVRTFFAQQGNFDGLGISPTSNGLEDGFIIIQKAKLIPEEMYEYENGKVNDISSPFGRFWISPRSKYKDKNDNKSFYISLYDIPQEACIELATMDWQANSGNQVISITVNEDEDEFFDNGYFDVCETNAKTVCSKDLPVDIDKASTICSYSSNNINIRFY